ncbi:MAG: hypothetical protein N0E59_02190 [Candidatus Thiodiazotropha taylori]|nr:hypothetical protein [Candidatus Thiodiazotropha taylori]MCG8051916.1 hypothetical protein [Candidatus Thiodiazotropha taylori]MCG8108688.1 hypothetical protein [Candidatus Thiodiazotropha taylori]MCG8109552.1 hypothetical protein [Candidatus Thiodiazotropha taylori]MCW4281024.1 hypothetical protein [Candidatus Thiodiazotropha taylori]
MDYHEIKTIIAENLHRDGLSQAFLGRCIDEVSRQVSQDVDVPILQCNQVYRLPPKHALLDLPRHFNGCVSLDEVERPVGPLAADYEKRTWRHPETTWRLGRPRKADKPAVVKRRLRLRAIDDPVSLASEGRPTGYQYDGKQLVLDCPTDRTRFYRLRYRRQLVLSEDEPTNPIADKYPDLYINGGTANGFDYFDEPNAQVYREKFTQSYHNFLNIETRMLSAGAIRSDVSGYSL